MATENEKPNVDLMEVMKGLQDEVAGLRAEKAANDKFKQAEEIAESKFKQIVDQAQREKDATERLVDRLVQERLETVRKEARIEFPVSLRKGNLAKTDRQLLDIVMGQKAAQTTGSIGGGAEWIPTELASELIRDKDKEATLRRAFRVINMPTNPYKLPIRTLLPKVYANNTEATALANQSNLGTDDIILTAKKLMGEIEVSTEDGEDSIVPVLPEIRAAIASAFAIAEESAFLQGDTAGNFSADDDAALPGGANDPRKALDGLLKLAAITKTIGSATGRPGFSDFNAVRALLGKYGRMASELVWIVGTDTYANVLLNLPEYRTPDEYGPQAVSLTGELGQLAGVSVLVSGGFADSALVGGVYAQGGILAWRRNVVIGDRRQLTIKTWEDVKKDTNVVIPTQRVTIQTPITNAANKAKGIANVTFQWA